MAVNNSNKNNDLDEIEQWAAEVGLAKPSRIARVVGANDHADKFTALKKVGMEDTASSRVKTLTAGELAAATTERLLGRTAADAAAVTAAGDNNNSDSNTRAPDRWGGLLTQREARAWTGRRADPDVSHELTADEAARVALFDLDRTTGVGTVHATDTFLYAFTSEVFARRDAADQPRPPLFCSVYENDASRAITLHFASPHVDAVVVLAVEARRLAEVLRRTAGATNVFVVVLPYNDPGAPVAHEFLRLMGLALVAEVARVFDVGGNRAVIPALCIADDDIDGFTYVESVDEVKTWSEYGLAATAAVLDLCTATLRQHEDLMCVSPNRANNKKYAGLERLCLGTRADSFFVLRVCDTLRRVHFLPRSALCVPRNAWETADKTVLRRITPVTKGKKVCTVHHARSQGEDYTFHLMLAATCARAPKDVYAVSASLLQVCLHKHGKGSTRNIDGVGMPSFLRPIERRLELCRIATDLVEQQARARARERERVRVRPRRVGRVRTQTRTARSRVVDNNASDAAPSVA